MILDRADDHAHPHPSDNPDATGRSVLFGVLQHVGAELSAHETITAEQEHWGSIAQLAAEYETIAAAAQRDRWATLIRASGLTAEQADAAIESADVAFTGTDLRQLPAALAHARRGRRIMTGNIGLALAIIVVLFPLALFGVLGLAAVVLVHEIAEVIVILNGLRAARTRKERIA